MSRVTFKSMTSVLNKVMRAALSAVMIVSLSGIGECAAAYAEVASARLSAGDSRSLSEDVDLQQETNGGGLDQRLEAVSDADGVVSRMVFSDNSSYPWVYDETFGGIVSSNKGVDSSESVTTLTFDLADTARLSFDWLVSSQLGDKFYLYLVKNGKREALLDGWEEDGSGSYSDVLSSGSYRLIFSYEKDDSRSSRDDRAGVNNISFSRFAINGVSGTASWSLDIEGNLEIKPVKGNRGELGDISSSAGGAPWAKYSSQIRSIRVGGIVATKTCQNMFRDCENLLTADLSGLDVSSVTDMSGMFSGCPSLWSLSTSGWGTPDDGVPGWDTSSVTNMGAMFSGCSSLSKLDASGWDTSSVTNMNSMFSGCSSLSTLDVSRWSVSSVTDMGAMFSGCSSLVSLDVSGWNVSSVANMNSMFSGCSSLSTLDVSRWSVSSVTDMGAMFSYCYRLSSLDLSRWNTSSVTNMRSMFYYCSSLSTLDLSRWNTSSVTDMGCVFLMCSSLSGVNISDWDTSSVVDMSELFFGCSSLRSLDLTGWVTSSVTDMGGMFNGCSSLGSLDLTGWVTSSVIDMGWMFNSCSSLTSLNLSSWNTSSLKYAFAMFDSCSMLSSIFVGKGWDFSGVITSENMFSGCTALVGGQGTVYDANKTDRAYARVDGGSSAPGYLTEAPLIWTACGTCVWAIDDEGVLIVKPEKGDRGQLAEFDSSTGVGPWSERASSIRSVRIEGTVVAKTCRGMFRGCTQLTKVDLFGLDTSSVTNMSSMFRDCRSLTTLDLYDLDTSSVTNTSNMFRGCSQLKSIAVDSDWSTSKVTSSDRMFDGCTALVGGKGTTYKATKIDKTYARIDGGSSAPGYLTASVEWIACGTCVWSIDPHGLLVIKPAKGDRGQLAEFDSSTGIAPWTEYASAIRSARVEGTVVAKTCRGMFRDCASLETVDLSGLDVSSATDMGYMFSGCRALASLDVSGWDTSSVTNMSYMFSFCCIASLDVSGWDTSSVTDMSYMFDRTDLTSLDVSGWDTSSVTDMSYMFNSCSVLTSLDPSNWDTHSVTNMSGMFGWTPLTSLDLSRWDTSSVTNMSKMFWYCRFTSLDLSGWDTSSATDMGWMFDYCMTLTSLDLSGWITSSVTNTSGMFCGCSKLRSIFVGTDWGLSSVTNSESMFEGCTALVGGKGTTYQWGKTNKTYARVDGGSSAPGYLTASTKWKECGTCLWTIDEEGTLVIKPARGQRGELSSFDESTGGAPWLERRWMIRSVRFEGTVVAKTCRNMFRDCVNLASVDLSGLDTSSVTVMGGMFNGCSGLESLDLSGLNTSSVTDMSYMFNDCVSLTSLDLLRWNTRSLKSADNLFGFCSRLGSILVGAGWDFSGVTSSENMFLNCTALVGGRGTAYDASKVDKTYARMDGGSSAPGYLTDVLEWSFCGTCTWAIGDDGTLIVKPTVGDYGELASFDKSAGSAPWLERSLEIRSVRFEGTVVAKTCRNMFRDCVNLASVNLSGLDISSVTDLGGMFMACSSLASLDLSGWNTRLFENVDSLFRYCSSLSSITVGSGWDLSGVTSSENMFLGCTALVGGQGTVYDASKVDKTYARMDGGSSAPGYLTCGQHVSGLPTQENRVEPTCINAGSCDLVTRCSRCGAEISRQVQTIDPLGHAWGDWVTLKEPTASEEGLEQRACLRDSSHIEQRPVAKLDSSTVCVSSAPLNSGVLSGGGQYVPGASVMLSARPVEGYRFTGWYLDGTLVSVNPDYGITVEHDVAFEARFEANATDSLSVSVGQGSVRWIDSLQNSGTWQVDQVGVRYARGMRIELEAVPSSGFTFLCWADAQSGRVLSYDSSISMLLVGDSSIRACYVKSDSTYDGEDPSITHTVTFCDLDGTILSTEVIAHGQGVQEPGHGNFAGFVFTGWSKPFDCVTSNLVVDALYERVAECGDGFENDSASGATVALSMADRVKLDGGSQLLAMNVTWSVPSGFSVQQVGILRSLVASGQSAPELALDGVDGSAVKRTVTVLVTSSGVFEYSLTLKGSSANKACYARGYAIIRDDRTGELCTYYSEVVRG